MNEEPAREAPVEAILTAISEQALVQYTKGGEQPYGCFVNTVGVGEAPQDSDAMSLTSKVNAEAEAEVANRLRQARDAGDFPEEAYLETAALSMSLSKSPERGSPPFSPQREKKIDRAFLGKRVYHRQSCERRTIVHDVPAYLCSGRGHRRCMTIRTMTTSWTI